MMGFAEHFGLTLVKYIGGSEVGFDFSLLLFSFHFLPQNHPPTHTPRKKLNDLPMSLTSTKMNCSFFRAYWTTCAKQGTKNKDY